MQIEHLKDVVEKAKEAYSAPPEMEYHGSLDAVLNEIEQECASPRAEMLTPRLRLHPPRMIRAVLDYKVLSAALGGDTAGIEDLLRQTIDLSLDIYRNSGDNSKGVQRLRKRIEKSADCLLLHMPLNQPTDGVTWFASNYKLSAATSERLKQTLDNTDILFIALAHGGVAAGMDVYINYCEKTGSTDSVFYPVRFSAHKKSDEKPHLSHSEIEYLQRTAVGRQVVIFDEDRATGTTLNKARTYFSSILPGSRVIVATNMDIRSAMEWDKCKITSIEMTYILPEICDESLHDEIQKKFIDKLTHEILSIKENKSSLSPGLKLFMNSENPFEEVFNNYSKEPQDFPHNLSEKIDLSPGFLKGIGYYDSGAKHENYGLSKRKKDEWKNE